MNKGKTSINDLSDDALIMIFSNLAFLDKVKLPMVCKRWRVVCDSYNLFSNQYALGTVSLPNAHEEDQFTCRSHTIPDKDCIYDTLFRCKPPTRGPLSEFQRNAEESEKRLVVKKDILHKSLNKVGQHLKILGLNFCHCVDDETLLTISRTCKCIEHLDLSFSSAAKCFDGVRGAYSKRQYSNSINSRSCKSLSDAIGHSLVHLNLSGFTGITDNALKKLFEGCQKLEEIHLSINQFGPLRGYSLTDTPRSVKKVSLLVEETDIDNERSIGSAALLSLSKSAAKENINALRIRRSLRIAMLDIIAANFPHLKNLDVGDWFLDVRLTDNYSQVGSVIAKMKELEVLTMYLPEVIKFDDGFTTIIKSCRKLKKLLVYGGPVADATLELLPLYISNLELLTLSYMKTDAATRLANRFTNAAFKSFAQLRKLKHLQLNGVNITDEGVKDFFDTFAGDLNQLNVFDVRNCSKLTRETLKLCIEKSKLRDGKSQQPLKVCIHGTAMKMSKNFKLPSTIIVSSNKLEKNFGRNYFMPNVHDYDIDDIFGIFINDALDDFMIFYNSDESDSSDDDSIMNMFDEFDYFDYFNELEGDF
ncbi:hypothetical protein B4U79_16830 [Dinothrombium tinctorium]|uniref:F-box domain-containing protein n=1 Tax=Dinothrombium tinctorium TaxID=1965070 RepID=A0A3S3PZP4_9ACAR|nr:hypothetical protein B4U79_16830 [Dinothrombium tinctorium]